MAQIKLRESYEKSWALSVATQPNRDMAGQKETYRLAEQIGRVGSKGKRKSAFDVVTDRAAKIRMIGSAWASAGERWSRGHEKEVKWLEREGVTLDEAAGVFQSWWDERMAAADRATGKAKDEATGEATAVENPPSLADELNAIQF